MARFLENHEKSMFVDIINGEKDDLERNADAFSANKLVVPSEYSAFIQEECFDKNSITAFARRINIHPGIVVGRLQHDGHIRYNMQNGLKEKMIWNSALISFLFSQSIARFSSRPRVRPDRTSLIG